MGLISWSMSKVKNLTIWDWVMLKTDLIIVGLVIGAYVSDFVKTYLWYIITLWVILEVVLLYRIFRK